MMTVERRWISAGFSLKAWAGARVPREDEEPVALVLAGNPLIGSGWTSCDELTRFLKG